MRPKWPNPLISDNLYRKLKCQVLRITKVDHGVSSKKQHHKFVIGIQWPKESILGCQESLTSPSEINIRGVQHPLSEPLTQPYQFCRCQGA